MKVGYAATRAIYGSRAFRQEVLGAINEVFADSDGTFAEQNKSLVEKIHDAGETAFEKLFEMLTDAQTSPQLKARIAQDFLNRREDTQAGMTVRTVQLNPNQLKAAAGAARELDNVITIKKAG